MHKFDEALQSQVYAKLTSWAAVVVASAQSKAPVRTGFLRSSIYVKVQGWVAQFGALATYAIFVENGTRKMRAQPFLFPAVQAGLPALEQLLVDAIEQAKADAGFASDFASFWSSVEAGV